MSEKQPYILGTVFARGGSKGVPQKNVKDLVGKWTWHNEDGSVKEVKEF